MFSDSERTIEKDQEWIAALEHELAAYEQAGRHDRAAEVRAQIARVKGEEPAKASRPARKQPSTRLRGEGKETR